MKVDCDIIRDLIPSYLDKVSSEATNKLVEKHLETCKNCLEELQNMSKDVDAEEIEKLEGQGEKIDYLKGYRRNKIKQIIFGIAWTIIIILAFYLLDLLLPNWLQDVEYPININKVNVEYMYKEYDPYKKCDRLFVYLYSDKYTTITCTRYGSGEAFEQEGIMQIRYRISGKGPIKSILHNNHVWSGYNESFLLENVDKIIVEDDFRREKEIWNKNMEVQSKEEWEKWFEESYVPNEVKEHNMDWNPSKWRHLYKPKT